MQVQVGSSPSGMGLPGGLLNKPVAGDQAGLPQVAPGCQLLALKAADLIGNS